MAKGEYTQRGAQWRIAAAAAKNKANGRPRPADDEARDRLRTETPHSLGDIFLPWRHADFAKP